MAPEHWDNRMSRILGAWIGQPGRGGAPLLLLVNGRAMDASFQLPPGDWVAELDTTAADGRSPWRCQGTHELMLGARSVMLLRDEATPARP
jgi:glycogen operon protein